MPTTRPSPAVGKLYLVRHSRKGTFAGILLRSDGLIATVRIVVGMAKMLNGRPATLGDEVTFLLSQAELEEV